MNIRERIYEKNTGTPFSEAAREGIPCVLDTDTELKVAKYTKCGMKNTAKSN